MIDVKTAYQIAKEHNTKKKGKVSACCETKKHFYFHFGELLYGDYLEEVDKKTGRCETVAASPYDKEQNSGKIIPIEEFI
ncbi:MAG: hypothetical protein LBL93_02125 [Ruminococcus sp.]|jgi:hypothetical protein|nr:hypothetical protein [Ruminococcus sp.]